MALEEETCLEDELLMLCWLLWEDTELGRPCWNRRKFNALAQSNKPTINTQYNVCCGPRNPIFPPYLVGVRHGLAHAARPSLGHGGDAVGGQRFLLAVSSVLRLHHGVGPVLLLLLLLLLAASSVGKIGTTTAGLDGTRGGEQEVDRGRQAKEGHCK